MKTDYFLKINLYLLFFFLGTSLAFAQNKPMVNSKLLGTVVDAKTKDPLPGALVQIEGVTNQTQTNGDGKFELITGQKFPYTLEVSYMGYEKAKIVANNSPIFIELKEIVNELSSVVVVGYGTQKRSDVTGAISSVSQQALKQPVSSLDQTLKGAVSGVQVTQTSGEPGGGVSIRIRGGASIQGGNEPLYVIDGFPVYNEASSSGVIKGNSSNPLASINPSDIESIDILKDASATAIYGSRGANGVVIITTKKGKADKSVIQYDGSIGLQEIQKKIDVLNAKEFANLRNEVFYDTNPLLGKYQYLSQAEIDALGEGTNWQNEAFRTAKVQNHQISLSGGSNKSQYYVSGNYLDQEGIVRNTDFSRLGFKANINAAPTEKLKFNASITASKTDANIAPTGFVNSLLLMPPTATIYDADGAYTLRNPFENIFANPIATINETINKQITNRVLATTFAEYGIIKDLNFKVLFGADYKNTKEKYYVPSTIYEGLGTSGAASLGSSNYYSWLNENTLSYNKQIEKHNLNFLVGFTQQEAENEYFNAGSQQFVTDDLTYNNLQSGSVILRPNSDTYSWVLHSYLARVNYNYNNKYYFTASVRRDGSSRFGAKNKWGNFPSAALSWKVSNEDFFKPLANTISDLKVRASFGTTGNLEIGQYQSLSTLYNLNYLFGNQVLVGFAPSRIANDNLGWETTYQYDGGVDVGFFNGKINLALDFYYKKTTDLLLNVEIPWTSGYATSLQNFGSVANKGFELGINSKNISGNFSWNTDFNFSINRNKVLEIGNGESSYISGNYIIQVGKPLGLFYGNVANGILQTGEEASKGAFTGNAIPKAGDRLYQDINGDGKFTVAADKTIIGSAQADFFFGLTNNFSYKNFDLSVFIQGAVGNQILNTNRQNLEMFTGQQNASKDALNRWTVDNPSTTLPRAKLDPAPVFSNVFVEDGTFVRLKNVSLGYNVPKAVVNKLNVGNINLFLTGQNLLTWTNYSGFDPEVTSGSNVSPGTDAGIYPISRTLTAGLKVTF